MGYKLNKETVKKAIEGSLGNYSTIAQKCGVTRQAVTEYFKKFPDLKELADQDREKLTDVAENHLAVAIRDGNIKYCWEWMKTKGKDRGFTEKTELEHSGGIQTNKPSAKELRELYEKHKNRESSGQGNSD